MLGPAPARSGWTRPLATSTSRARRWTPPSGVPGATIACRPSGSSAMPPPPPRRPSETVRVATARHGSIRTSRLAAGRAGRRRLPLPRAFTGATELVTQAPPSGANSTPPGAGISSVRIRRFCTRSRTATPVVERGDRARPAGRDRQRTRRCREHDGGVAGAEQRIEHDDGAPARGDDARPVRRDARRRSRARRAGRSPPRARGRRGRARRAGRPRRRRRARRPARRRRRGWRRASRRGRWSAS